MKKIFLFAFFLNPTLTLISCSSANSVQNSKSTEHVTDVFDIKGKWIIKDVVFVGNPRDIKVSKELNFYALFGTGWSAMKGRYFVFESDNHWNSSIFDKEINQEKFTYSLTDTFTLTIEDEKLNYQFQIEIKDSTANNMTWHIGNEINLFFERVQ